MLNMSNVGIKKTFNFPLTLAKAKAVKAKLSGVLHFLRKKQ